MATATLTKEEARKSRGWRVVDASGLTLGRLASEVAIIIRGKDKPSYTPHVDDGDFVIVINASKVRVTGNKLNGKLYVRHSGYPGGLKSETLGDLLRRQPERVIEEAVRGMLPKGKLGRQIRRKLKVYAGTEHPHQAQRPEVFTPKFVRSAG